MGVMTYVIAADAKFPERVAGMGIGAIDAIGDICRGLDQIKLSNLNAILTASSYDPDFMMTDDALAFQADPTEGPWMWIFPESHIRLLAGVETKAIGPIVDQWIMTEEFTLPHINNPREDAEIYIGLLIKNSKTCLENAWKMYLYVSL